MIRDRNIGRLLLILLTLFLLFPSKSFAKDNELETLIIMTDSLSYSQIEDLEIENGSIGLMNIKTRKPYSKESLYRTLNLGRKTSKKEMNKREIESDYLGDVLKGEGLFYWGEEESKLELLLENSNGESKGSNNGVKYDLTWLTKNIDDVFKNNNIMALEYDLGKDKNRLVILKKLLQNNNIKKNRQVYIIPTEVSEEDSMYINKYLVPVVFLEKEAGILISDSTKRQGIIAIEDIPVSIKESYGYENDFNIGKKIRVINKKLPISRSKSIYKESINLLLIASIFHGIFYIAQVLMFINIIMGRKTEWIEKFYIFANNNIVITLFMSFIGIHSNLILYLVCTLILNGLITELMHKEIKALSFSFLLTYGVIIFGVLLNPEVIYNSYMGFNNLVYGARFYGFNNGMAAVLLATSILITSFIYNSRIPKFIKNPIIFLIPVINIVMLSARFGANTGGFITAILLFILNTYYYFRPNNINFGTVVLFLLVAIIIFGINIYLDSLSKDQSHTVQFILRVKENGIKELLYMANFKLKELLKLTIMPPFSIVLITQFISVKKLYRRNEIDVKILLLTSILGFLINDTGNILLIYMLNYLLLKLYFYDDSIFSSNH